MKEEEASNQMVGPCPCLALVCAAWTLHLLFYTVLANGPCQDMGVNAGDKLHCGCESKMNFVSSAIWDVFSYDKPLSSNELSGNSRRI